MKETGKCDVKHPNIAGVCQHFGSLSMLVANR